MATQEIFTLLYEIIDRLERIEKQLDFDLENLPDGIDETFDRVFEDVKKPKLSIVRTDNIVEFDKND
tara:strand:- start:118 stop:318 length:201 start_codon:yes stop_codon:yes gene_type:complete